MDEVELSQERKSRATQEARARPCKRAHRRGIANVGAPSLGYSTLEKNKTSAGLIMRRFAAIRKPCFSNSALRVR